MAEYEYQATTSAGHPVRGSLIADDEAAARRELEARGFSVADVVWCPVVDEAGTLGDAEIGTLVHALGTAAANRVPLELTLAVLAEDKENPRLADVARRIHLRLQQGATVDRAVADLDNELPTEIRGVVRAGIESGDLASSFECFTQQRLASQRIGRRIRAAIAYPIVIMSLTVPILLLISYYIIPMFADIYEDLDFDLPAPTLLILQTGQQVPGLIVGVLLALLAVPVALRILGGRWLFHRFRAATPIFGTLWAWSGQREYAAMLASFLELRLPLSRAVECTSELIDDRNVARSCRRVVERLEEGESLGASMNRSISFDRTLASMAAWGETYGLLPDSLRIAADVFEDRIDQHLSLIRRLISPAALIVIGGFVIFVVVGLFLPLIQMLYDLSR
jgi:type IV pilus assembly protein PilC